MPTYEYEYLDSNGEPTGERFEVSQSMKDAAYTQHPETGVPCRRAIVAPAIGGFNVLGKIKPPAWYRDRLKEIKKRNPGSNIKDRW